MNRFTRMLIAVALMLPAAAPAAGQAEDEAGVRAAVEAYLAAHASGSAEPLRPFFHPVLNLYFVRDDSVNVRSGTEYLAGFRGTPPADEAQRRRWISMVDVTGDAAIARVVLDYPGRVFTDYFTLLRVNGRWQIVSKTFTVQEKAP